MLKVHEKIIQADFSKSLKKLIIVMLCVALLGGGFSAVMLQTQIKEVVTHAGEWESDGEEHDKMEGREDGFGHKEEHAAITKPTAAALITVGITCLAGFVLLILFWLLTAAWIYQAAVRSGMNGLFWLVAGLAGNVFAAVVFQLVRSYSRMRCPACGSYQHKKTHYCTKCGTELRIICADCDAVCAVGDTFCGACGEKLHDSENS